MPARRHRSQTSGGQYPPLDKYMARVTMEAACGHTAKSLRFRPPFIPQAVAFMVMVLAFHTEDPDGVEYMLNIFLFPELSPSAGSKAVLLTRKWGAIMGGGTLNVFADMSLLMGKQKVAPIAGWDEAGSQLEVRRTLTVNTPSPKRIWGKDMGPSLL